MSAPKPSPLDSDKIGNGLLEEYRTLFAPLRHKPIRMMEIGILRGGSLAFWSEMFSHPDAIIIGVDIHMPDITAPDRVVICRADQNDASGLREIADAHGPFDLIIDDASHHRRETENCFRTLFDRLNAGGYYVIEDWAAGYWKHQPEYGGMVELVTGIIERAPDLQIEAFKVVLERGKAMALFQRGERGWTS